MAAPKLPADVAGKYKMLAGHGVGEYHWSGHRVDLQTITLDQATSLVKQGFPYLIAKKQPRTLI
ncbi:hypothetical protein KHS38_12085 [Mucilaginibacter sp. Bleaf8]|uniref:hypothetical protein n=1 Tax=Mucilaginibacter sp. Bleaf8 TaxID=2834430 RepID=UPI001BCFAED0|nr:hypothetical protein [Mucilaginibacter sp. Bleaf8]MBS7565144.1 hypothetical protein [Mucilaginibacter sp. Bleaf8]